MRQQMPTPRPGVPSVQAAVRNDLVEREIHGIREYGTPLQPFNGRDGLRDAYEEALDLACYLKQCLMERDGVSGDGAVSPQTQESGGHA